MSSKKRQEIILSIIVNHEASVKRHVKPIIEPRSARIPRGIVNIFIVKQLHEGRQEVNFYLIV